MNVELLPFYKDQDNQKSRSEIMIEYYRNNPESRKSRSKALKGITFSDARKAVMRKSASREKIPLPAGYKIDKNSKMATNKECASYLGCYIAEQVLSKIFKDVQVMPYKNPGYDFICGNDYKIDVKSCAIGYKGGWQFTTCRNTICDYFLFLAFESRNDLTPNHLWLVPSNAISHLTSVSISKSRLTKWAKYEQSLDKVIACCNEMKQSKEMI